MNKPRGAGPGSQVHVFARANNQEGLVLHCEERYNGNGEGRFIILQFDSLEGLETEGIDETNQGSPFAWFSAD